MYSVELKWEVEEIERAGRCVRWLSRRLQPSQLSKCASSWITGPPYSLVVRKVAGLVVTPWVLEVRIELVQLELVVAVLVGLD